jgi:hypothetical protein
MVIFFLGFFSGLVLAFLTAIIWGYKISIKEEEYNKEMIKDFQDKMIESEQLKNFKRYKS